VNGSWIDDSDPGCRCLLDIIYWFRKLLFGLTNRLDMTRPCGDYYSKVCNFTTFTVWTSYEFDNLFSIEFSWFVVGGS
jgi:hypothetical protein